MYFLNEKYLQWLSEQAVHGGQSTCSAENLACRLQSSNGLSVQVFHFREGKGAMLLLFL